MPGCPRNAPGPGGDDSNKPAPTNKAETAVSHKEPDPRSNVTFPNKSSVTKTPPPPPENKSVEFADLPPALQSELEFLCFQAKAKGKFQFNECIKAKLLNR